MCLYLTKQNKEPKVAEKCIECYKLVLFNHAAMVTPFIYYPVVLGRVVNASPKEPVVKDAKYCDARSRYKFYVTLGTIHTFKTIEGAKKIARMVFRCEKVAIVKCTIPTGSLYFEGAFDDTGIQCYASTSVRYWKKIVYKK